MLPPTYSVLPDVILYSPAVTDKSPIITPPAVEDETNAGTKNDNVCAPDAVAVVACDRVNVVPLTAATVVPEAIPGPDTPCPTKILVLVDALKVIVVEPEVIPALEVFWVIYGYIEVVFTIMFPK